MSGSANLDVIDLQILDLLREDGRRTTADIAKRVNLSAASVGRRIHRLERTRVITGYTVVVDDTKTGSSLEAFTELRYAGDTDVTEILKVARSLPEVREAYTTAGDPDALVRLQVSDVSHLHRVLAALRRSGAVTGTKTLIILERWTRASEPGTAGAAADR